MNTHFKITSLVCALLISQCYISCSKNDPDPIPETENANDNDGNNGGLNPDPDPIPFDDPDGDGVDSTVEISENTDPNDPCSYLQTSQDYQVTTNDWKELDCDGDGVINRLEVDPDSNNTNDGNGTDPLNFCSLNHTYQTVEPSTEWNEFNCDDDCFTNGVEIRIGTNPTEPNTFNTSGVLEKTIPVGTPNDEARFSEDGTRYLGYRASGAISVSTFYDYTDGKINEVAFIESEQGLLFNVIFSYNNDDISSINYNGFLYDVTYEDDTITVLDPNSSGGPEFFSKVTLNPVTQKIATSQQYRFKGGNEYLFYDYSYTYDATAENVLQRTVEISIYNDSTGTFTLDESYTESFEYYSSLLNPVSEAAKALELQALLVDDPTGWRIGYTHFDDWGFEMTPALVSENVLKSYTLNGTLSAEYVVENCNGTGFPILTYRASTFDGVFFIYR